METRQMEVIVKPKHTPRKKEEAKISNASSEEGCVSRAFTVK